MDSDSDSDTDLEKDDENEVSTLKHVTKKFMVYRAGEQSCDYNKTMIYTEDIGDLCMFLGHSQKRTIYLILIFYNMMLQS